MVPRILADLVLLSHAAFVLFVAAGGFLALRWRRVAWAHVPCALYGAAIELVGWVCPLTPLEQRLRRAAGQAGYAGGFLDHYLRGVLYPARWEHIHLGLGVAVVAGNAALYVVAVRRWRSRSRTRTDTGGRSNPSRPPPP
ncbi:MAG: DUF2784 domain-containing protein [Candidatus Palauibacterales bacterium]|nr:DUF2784 domain-containing protein [Candidatus Palauibacterales bacterium]MDP2528151.1 DUF2784 domain-containing protein [Candidatus Palauibacterales bacterium]MDP2584231.1 DUF2784 domain-containing protein [Candidatus Palauibacterales bacterium]